MHTLSLQGMQNISGFFHKEHLKVACQGYGQRPSKINTLFPLTSACRGSVDNSSISEALPYLTKLFQAAQVHQYHIQKQVLPAKALKELMDSPRVYSFLIAHKEWSIHICIKH